MTLAITQVVRRVIPASIRTACCAWLCASSTLACESVALRLPEGSAVANEVARSVLEANAHLLAETTPAEPEVATDPEPSPLSPEERARFERFWRQALEEGYAGADFPDAEPDTAPDDEAPLAEPRWGIAARQLPPEAEAEAEGEAEGEGGADAGADEDIAELAPLEEPLPDEEEEEEVAQIDPLEEELAFMDERVGQLEQDLLAQQQYAELLGLALALTADQMVAARALAIRLAAQQQLLHNPPDAPPPEP